MQHRQPSYSDLLQFSGLNNCWPSAPSHHPSTGNNYSAVPQDCLIDFTSDEDMASSTEQRTTAEARAGNVRNMIDRLSKVDVGMHSNLPATNASGNAANNGSFGLSGKGDIHLRRVNLNQRMAVVRFSYAAQQEDELNLKEGDELEILEDVEDGWARGQIVGHVNTSSASVAGSASSSIGKIGLFPTNFVSFASEFPSSNTSTFTTSTISSLPRAMEDKSGKEHSANGLSATESVSATVKNLPESILTSPVSNTTVLPSTFKTTTSAFTPPTNTIVSSSRRSNAVFPAESSTTPEHQPQQVPSSGQTTANKGKELAKVMYKYEAANPDELALPEGAIITVLNKNCEDEGWYEGEYNGKRGLFPENFVKLITEPQIMDKSSPSTTHPPPALPAKPAKPNVNAPLQQPNHYSLAPVANARDSTITATTVSDSLAARPVHEERKSMIAGLQSKLFPQGKLPPQFPHKSPPTFSSSSTVNPEAVNKDTRSTSSSAEDLNKLSSLTKTRPMQANKRPPSMNFRASKHIMTNSVTTFDESPGAPTSTTLFQSSITSAPSMTTSMVTREVPAAPKPSSLPSTGIGRHSTIPTSGTGQSSSISTENQWISRHDFEKYKAEMNRKLDELAQQIAELKATKSN
ncbi:variant SH3 domain-containing protein [Ditylenchus destructor]|uniref:Variant SH3 domain-containing protein n=1 Tax=Ditylenchus destructor TaxID=166010 RepID=A0AAD4N270_9BILA|nr:variant SH3 domain-containing protein [Ditylenchus destructor]